MIGGARSGGKQLDQANVRLRELHLHYIIEGHRGIGLGEHPNLHSELGLGVNRPAHDGAGAASFLVQLVVNLHQTRQPIRTQRMSEVGKRVTMTECRLLGLLAGDHVRLHRGKLGEECILG